jgi:hypothetical protein
MFKAGRLCPAICAATVAGLVLNLDTGLFWALVPMLEW